MEECTPGTIYTIPPLVAGLSRVKIGFVVLSLKLAVSPKSGVDIYTEALSTETVFSEGTHSIDAVRCAAQKLRINTH